MAVETHLPPGDLLDLDDEMLLTLVEVHAQRWTRQEHLLTDLLHLVDRGNRLLEVVAGYKRHQRSKPLEDPRPKPVKKRRKANTDDLRALAQQWGGTVEGVIHA